MPATADPPIRGWDGSLVGSGDEVSMCVRDVAMTVSEAPAKAEAICLCALQYMPRGHSEST